LWKHYTDQVIRRCIHDDEVSSVLQFCHSYSCRGHFGPKRIARKVLQSGLFWPTLMARKVLQSGLFWPTLFRDSYLFCKTCDRCQHTGDLGPHNQMPMTPILIVEIFDVWGIDFMGLFPPSFGNIYILLVINYVSK